MRRPGYLKSFGDSYTVPTTWVGADRSRNTMPQTVYTTQQEYENALRAYSDCMNPRYTDLPAGSVSGCAIYPEYNTTIGGRGGGGSYNYMNCQYAWRCGPPPRMQTEAEKAAAATVEQKKQELNVDLQAQVKAREALQQQQQAMVQSVEQSKTELTKKQEEVKQEQKQVENVALQIQQMQQMAELSQQAMMKKIMLGGAAAAILLLIIVTIMIKF